MRYQTTRQNILAKFRKPYAKKRKGVAKGRTVAYQGGVAGGIQRMTAALPPPPEVKNFDTTISIATDESDTKILISPLDILSGIIQGPGPSERIGRSIRVVGIVLRLNVGVTGGVVGPYTIDCLWDNQCNGAVPQITDVYTSTKFDALPNPEFSNRFQFVKRFSSPRTWSSFYDYVNSTIKCNKVVEYRTSEVSPATVAELTKSNLLMYFVTPLTGQVEGTIRVLYVDA